VILVVEVAGDLLSGRSKPSRSHIRNLFCRGGHLHDCPSRSKNSCVFGGKSSGRRQMESAPYKPTAPCNCSIRPASSAQRRNQPPLPVGGLFRFHLAAGTSSTNPALRKKLSRRCRFCLVAALPTFLLRGLLRAGYAKPRRGRSCGMKFTPSRRDDRLRKLCIVWESDELDQLPG